MTTLLDLIPTPRRAAGDGPDQWLINHLINAGHMSETGLTRRARVRTCTCRTPTIAALDDDVAALDAQCDPQPLTTLGEALAHIEGRWTYALRRHGDGYVLDRRDHLAIAGHPAGTQPRTDILREHRCHTRPLAATETTTTSFVEARPHDLPPSSPAPF